MSEPGNTRVLCVDDHEFLVEGLKAKLALEQDMEFAGWRESAEALLTAARETNANTVLLDIEMPGPDPFEVMKDIKDRAPEIRIIMLSAYVRDHYIDAAVKAGAWGYLSKSDDPDAVIRAIRMVSRGEFAFGPKVLERCQLHKQGRPVKRPASKLDRLTPRERHILRLIGKGLSRIEIAETIHRSPKTVDNHRAAIMEKLGIRDRVELARFAISEGIVEI